MADIRVGLVGCGSWAREAHLPYLEAAPGVELAGIADPELYAEPRKAPKGVARSLLYPSIEKLVSEVALDCLVISTPHSFHFSQVRYALENRINVHVDKPMATSASDAAALRRLAKRHRVVLSTHAQKRFMPGISWMRSSLASSFREVYHAAGSLSHSTHADFSGSWRNDPSLAGGGILMDSGYHVIDTLLFVLASMNSLAVSNVSALASPAAFATDAYATLIFRLDRTVVNVSAFRGTPPELNREDYVLLGDAGRVDVAYGPTRGPFKVCSARMIGVDGRRHDEAEFALTSSYKVYPLQLFLDAVRGDVGAHELIRRGLDVAQASVQILESAYSSIGVS